jgi:DNA-binding PadR family transcriptional regulator
MAENRAAALGSPREARLLDGAPTNSLVQWALIGLLIERSSYGYELAQRFERTYGGLLRLSGVSYVYTALDALKRRALIEEVEVGDDDDRRMPRVHYRVTGQGVRAYQERLLSQMREDDRRSRLLARQLALLVPEPELALAILDRYERDCLEEAEESPAVAARIVPRERRAAVAARLAAEERRLSLDARLAWVGYARRELKALSRAVGKTS